MEDWSNEELMRGKGLVKYEELEGKAKRNAYNRFAYKLDGSPKGYKPEEIMRQINQFWFEPVYGGTYCGTN